MEIEIKKLPKSELKIKTAIPWEKWKKFIDLAVTDISKEIKIKGFRPGKAPRNIIEQQVGEETILNNAAEKAIRENYADVLSEKKIAALGRPEVKILKIAEKNNLEYEINTAVMPSVKLNPWQEEIKKINQAQQGEKVEIKKDEVSRELKKLAGSRAKLITVNREAQKGDGVEIDFQVNQNGVPIENGSGKKHNLILGKGTFIPGFEDNLVGMKSGEEKEFELKFPEEYKTGGLAGQSALFKVKMNLVQERKVPEIDDVFAKSLGKFESLPELEKNIKNGLLTEKKLQQKEQRRAGLIEKLIEKIEVDLPEILIQEEIIKMINELEAQIQPMGTTLDKYLEQMQKTRQDLEKDWKPQAEKRIKAALALSEIAKNKEVKVSSKEVEEEMNKTLSRYGDRKSLEKNIDLKKLYSYAEGTLINEKVFQILEKI